MKKALIFILLSAVSLQAKADWDPSGIISALEAIFHLQDKQLPNLSDINSNTKNTAKNTEDTFNKLKEQKEFLEKNLNGNHGFGNLHNDLDQRLWSADNWDEALKGGGGQSAQKFKDAQDNYNRIYPVKKASDIAGSLPPNNLTQAHYEQSSQISRAALAASKVSYDNINTHIRTVNDILKKLESDDAKTEKGAIDLNTRLVAELSFIQLDMLKIQSIQAQLTATQLQGDVNGLSDQTTFLNTKEP
jgi:type IV secretion system protein VirB5